MKLKKIKLELNKETISVLNANEMTSIDGGFHSTQLCGGIFITANIVTIIHETLDNATLCPHGPCTVPGGGGNASAIVENGGCLISEVVIKG